MGVGADDIKWSRHEDVVAHIRASGSSLVIRIITPIDCSYLPTGNQTRGQRSQGHGGSATLKSHGQKAQTTLRRPLSAGHQRVVNGGTLGSKDKGQRSSGGSSKSVKSSGSGWTLRRNRSKSRDKKLSENEVEMKGR